MSDTSTHVTPEPVEAAEPSPTTAEALIRYRAVLHAQKVAKGLPEPTSFPGVLAIIDSYEHHRDSASLDLQERAHAWRRDNPERLSEWATILRLAEQRKEGR